MKFRKKINEHFFEEPSKEMYYALGAFFIGYKHSRYNGFTFTAPSKELVSIIANLLESEHKISNAERRNSFFISAKNVPVLRKSLEELCVNEVKEKRTFPKDLPEEYMSHFIRGFLDVRSRYVIVDGLPRLDIYFNNPFVLGLNEALKKYSGVKKNPPNTKDLLYIGNNVINIYHYIYSDWEFIKEKGLYVKEKKKLFEEGYPLEKIIHPQTVKVNENVEKAKTLILEGNSSKKVSELLGYNDSNAFGRAFTTHVGKSTRQFLLEQRLNSQRREYGLAEIEEREAILLNPMLYPAQKRIELAKELLTSGKSVQETIDKLGYLNRGSFRRAFKESTNMNITEFKESLIPFHEKVIQSVDSYQKRYGMLERIKYMQYVDFLEHIAEKNTSQKMLGTYVLFYSAILGDIKTNEPAFLISKQKKMKQYGKKNLKDSFFNFSKEALLNGDTGNVDLRNAYLNLPKHVHYEEMVDKIFIYAKIKNIGNFAYIDDACYWDNVASENERKVLLKDSILSLNNHYLPFFRSSSSRFKYYGEAVKIAYEGLLRIKPEVEMLGKDYIMSNISVALKTYEPEYGPFLKFCINRMIANMKDNVLSRN